MASFEDALQGSLDLPFPAGSKQVAGIVEGVQTDVMVMNFSDKIMLTISQEGRLSHWVCLTALFISKAMALSNS